MKKLVFTLICLSLVSSSQAKKITVDDNGHADFDNIQDAINFSEHGDTIIVKPGTYNRGIVFSGMAVTLTSEDPDDMDIVQSTIITSNSRYSVNFDFGEGNRSVLTGFTITGGEAAIGAGIHCSVGTSPTITDNIIKDCNGDGIHGEQEDTKPIISDNEISSNAGSGIYKCNGPITNNDISENNGGGIAFCDAEISGNYISYNVASSLGGGGLTFCKGNIVGNIIEYNYSNKRGGACYECIGSIVGNRIIGNTSQMTGGALSNCRGRITNNIITGNRSGNGGGLFSCYQIYNNTIVSNIAEETGGALSQCSYISNNIIAYNRANSIGGISGLLSNSSYNAFWLNEGGNFGNGATRGPGDIIADPFFVSNGYWDDNGTPGESDDFWVDGDYHVISEAGRWNPVDKIWISDNLTSPCIDAGGEPNDPNSDWTGELWPHGKRINMGAYGGTIEASMSLSNAGNIADLNPDVNDANDWVGYDDMLRLTDKWLSLIDKVPLAEDLNRNGIVDFADYAILINNWQPKVFPPQPPQPNPMTWATEPNATSRTAIEMTATIAASTDKSGVEYYFKNVSLEGHDSGWQEDPNYIDTGLTADTEYSYKVKARNIANLAETDYSELRSATTLPPDTIPPVPNPATWETEPNRISPSSIRMVATTASDESGVEYLFVCTSNPAYSSNWQDDPVYQPTFLPKSTYSFIVRTRDKSPNRNTTGDSPEVTVDLRPPTPEPNPMTWATKPQAISRTAIEMEATTATSTDGSSVEYYFQNITLGGHDSGWQEDPIYTDTGLTAGTAYSYQVKARNIANLAETDYSGLGSATTFPPDTTPPSPDPATWQTEPYSISPSSIRMVATTASDESGVEYFFACTSNPAYSSNWQSNPVYQATSLPKGTYSFVVRVRDKSPNQNTTGDSSGVTVDIQPPTPDTMQWAEGGEPREVYGGGGTWDYYAEMTAAEATDASGGVEYYFQCTTRSGFSRDWGASLYYKVLVGRSGQTHRFRVKARDINKNETAYSPELPMQ